jgi:hypothetical protein
MLNRSGEPSFGLELSKAGLNLPSHFVDGSYFSKIS